MKFMGDIGAMPSTLSLGKFGKKYVVLFKEAVIKDLLAKN